MPPFSVGGLPSPLVVFGASCARYRNFTGGQPDGNGHPYTALLLAPGITFCNGSLIADQTILTAGHCTSFWEELADAGDLDEGMVSFDPRRPSTTTGCPTAETGTRRRPG